METKEKTTAVSSALDDLTKITDEIRAIADRLEEEKAARLREILNVRSIVAHEDAVVRIEDELTSQHFFAKISDVYRESVKYNSGDYILDFTEWLDVIGENSEFIDKSYVFSPMLGHPLDIRIMSISSGYRLEYQWKPIRCIH